VWGITGRRKSSPRLRATVSFAGHQAHNVRLNTRGEPDGVIVRTPIDATGKKSYLLVGRGRQLEAKRQEIAQTHPIIQWEELDPQRTARLESRLEFDGDLTRSSLRRLAAKVAFEWLAAHRGRALLVDREFDPVRTFVLTGHEAELCCGVLSDMRLLQGPLNFPLPYHAVAIIAHPADHVLGAFVTFYSLFYYWVILSRRHHALWPWDDLLLEHPQVRDTENPHLRQHVGSVRVPWYELEQAYSRDPFTATRVVSAYAVQKFRAAAAAFYGPGNV
jgi:hypothetical protein